MSKMVNDNTIAGLESPTGKMIRYTTYYNIGKTRNVNFSGYASWNPLTNTRLTMNVWGGYSHLSDGQSLKNHGWNMSVWANAQQTIAKTWTVSVSIYKQTPGVSLQSNNGGYFSHDISITKKMLGDRLNITLASGNPFKKYFTYRQNVFGNNFKSSGTFKFEQRWVALAVSYRIGKLQSGVKKTSRTINNDDVMQGGKSQGGSGKPQ